MERVEEADRGYIFKGEMGKVPEGRAASGSGVRRVGIGIPPTQPGLGAQPRAPRSPWWLPGGLSPGGQASERHWSASTAFVVIQRKVHIPSVRAHGLQQAELLKDTQRFFPLKRVKNLL